MQCRALSQERPHGVWRCISDAFALLMPRRVLQRQPTAIEWHSFACELLGHTALRIVCPAKSKVRM